jgi:hypothetical protein
VSTFLIDIQQLESRVQGVDVIVARIQSRSQELCEGDGVSVPLSRPAALPTRRPLLTIAIHIHSRKDAIDIFVAQRLCFVL